MSGCWATECSPSTQRQASRRARGRYRSSQRALVRRCGLEPGPALRELELQILRHDPSLLPATAQVETVARRSRQRAVVAAAVVAVAPAHGHGDRRDRARPLESSPSDPRQSAARARPQAPTRSSEAFRSRGTLQLSSRRTTPSRGRKRTRAGTVSRIDLHTDAVKTMGEPVVSHSSRTTDPRATTRPAGISPLCGRSIRARYSSTGIQSEAAFRAGRRLGSLRVIDGMRGTKSHAYRSCPAPRRTRTGSGWSTRHGVRLRRALGCKRRFGERVGDPSRAGEADPGDRYPEPVRHQRRAPGGVWVPTTGCTASSASTRTRTRSSRESSLARRGLPLRRVRRHRAASGRSKYTTSSGSIPRPTAS